MLSFTTANHLWTGQLALIVRLLFWKTAIAWDPAASEYMDQALAPVADHDDATLDLLTKTAGAAQS